jgi:hypothetical protein
MLQNSLMIDSTDFHTGDNENVASIIKSMERMARSAELNSGALPTPPSV